MPARTVIVEHSTESPARDFQVAASLLAALRRRTGMSYRFVRVTGADDIALPGETREYVARSGSLVPNGWFWVERICPPPDLSQARHVSDRTLSQNQPSIVSINRRTLGAASFRAWQRALEEHFAAARWVSVNDDGATTVGVALELDRYGRLEVSPVSRLVDQLVGDPTTTDVAPVAPPATPQTTRIVVVGERAYHEYAYPAVRASLGDAADAVGCIVELRFVSAHRATQAEWRKALTDADGIVLPGGNDMQQVEAQITAATIALEERIPVLGLCLGMQTMVTAFARQIAGMHGAHLEETNPEAQPLTFRRLHQGGLAAHRIGIRQTRLVEGSLLERLYGRHEWQDRMNHRFALDRGIAQRLVDHGLEIGALGEGDVADAIAWPDHPFFVGAQGHPEQSSTSEQPHPLVVAFLQEVQGR
ncbi:hypothetical protein EPN44_05920 [bacterium]|nr:MAG: hypothetical protein EPN44_05920 [bacterium]